MVPRFFLIVSFMKFSDYYPDFKALCDFETLLLGVRGLGNPILANFTLMFLSRSLTTSADLDGKKSKSVLDEMLKILGNLSAEKPRTYEKITFEDYILVFKPSAQWICYILIEMNEDNFIFNVIDNLKTGINI